MDNEALRGVGSVASGNPESIGGSDSRGNLGTSGGTSEADELQRILDGTAAADAQRTGTPQRRPEYTEAPLRVDAAGEPIGEPRKRGRQAKKSVPVKACIAAVSLAFVVASLALVRSRALQASPAEKEELGTALAGAIETLPQNSATAKFFEWFLIGAPWAEFAEGMLEAVQKRFDYLREMNRPPEPKPSANVPREAPRSSNEAGGVILAPEPVSFA